MSTQPTPSSQPLITLPRLGEMKLKSEKITMLTCYEASFASLLEHCGVDVLLVGDSLGMVVAGHTSTLPVTMADMLYHTACVARGAKRSFIVADMPFGSYQQSPMQAYENAARLLAAGAHMVKIEGGSWLAPTVEFLHQRDIPTFSHIGLTPQSVHAFGGYKVQGKTETAAEQVLSDALALESAGAGMMLLEAIPKTLGTQITEALHIPTIGIGAGPECSGQVLVLHDMLGIYPGKKARFVRNFMDNSDSIEHAIKRYIQDVKTGAFPAPEHCF